jgi:tetratricopeptide (TPR) repeat protein
LKELVRAHRKVVNYRADLAGTYNSLGGLVQETGRRAEALDWYSKARKLQEELARDHPKIDSYRADLARIYNNLGLVQQEAGRRDEALEFYGKARELLKELARTHPEDVSYQDQLAGTYNSLGILKFVAGRWDEALELYETTRGLREQLVRTHPKVISYRVALAGTYVNLGNLTRDQGRPADALDWYAKGIMVLRQVLDTNPQLAISRLFLRNAYWGRARTLTQLARHAEAAKDWVHAAELDQGRMKIFFRLQRAVSLVHSGDHSSAVAEANAVAEAKDAQADHLYDAACVCALASSSVKQDTKVAERYASRAVELLQQSVAKGFKNVAHMKKDTDLDGLRGRDDFKKLMAQLEQPPQGERKGGPGQGKPGGR